MKGAKFLMDEKKYLKWYNKVGYGSGDLAGNMVYAFLTSLDKGTQPFVVCDG